MNNKQRIGYIDAMRGFSMVLVVFGHVLLMMGSPADSSILASVLVTFRMPLFFFVSGFFAFRTIEKWTAKLCGSILKRKIQAQVIGTIFFFAIFQLCRDKNPINEFMTSGLSWFWFTIVLFQMFLIYMALAVAEYITKCNKIVNSGVILISVIAFYIYVRSPLLQISNIMWNLLSWYYLTEYFQFFAVGILCRKYFPIVKKFLENDMARTFIILTYIISLLYVYGFDGRMKLLNSGFYNFLSMTVVRYAGLFSIFIVFSSNDKYFSGEYKPSRWLRYVGRRTLDIYFIHVFLLPNLIAIHPYLEGNGQTLSILVIGLFFAVANVAVCLLLSNWLRTSNFLSRWLFGEKSKDKEPLVREPILP